MESNRNNAGRPNSTTYHSKKGNNQGSYPPRRRFTPRKRTSESEDDGTCDLCVQAVKIYALGRCDHPICYRCSGKMRILCEEMHCAVCRVEIKKVIYSKSKRLFQEANALELLKYGKKNVWFTDEIVKNEYEKLFEHTCPICPDLKPEVSFKKLETHMRNQHKLFYCNLCVTNNKNFTDECKTYSREDLAKHRRIGDEDDTSHKGHPLCEFCDERYLDKDTLLKHLRMDHYFCHFCDKNGRNEYYGGYTDLREHYKKSHYLCEEGDCKEEKFTSVFATELDLKGHRTAAHSQSMTKQQQKSERNIDLGFQYANAPIRGGGRGPRNDDYGGGRGRGRGRGRGGADGRDNKKDEDLELAKALSLSEQEKKKSSKKSNDSKLQVLYPRIDRGDKKKPTEEEEPPPPNLVNDFPTLGAVGPDITGTYPTIQEEPPKPEIKPEEQPKLTAAYKIATAAGKSVGKISQEDFPTLGSNNKPLGGQPAGIWGCGSSTTSVPKKSKTKTPQQPVSVHIPQSRYSKANVNLGNKDDFPTLGGKSNGLVPGQSAIWGPLSSSHTPVTVPKKQKKKKTPTPQPKISNPSPQTKNTSSTTIGNSNVFRNDETVSVRVGKHTMRMTSAKHSAEIEDIEKPVEVPGFSGSASVKTVSADAFSLINHSSRNHVNFTEPPPLQTNDFPELGAASGNRIRGIGAAKTPWSQGNNVSNKKKSKKPLSLSDVSNDIFPSSTIENSLSTNTTKKGTPADHKSVITNFQTADDFPAITKPPPLSSYASNWQDGDKDICVADSVIREQNFQSQESDFPSLGGSGTNNKNSNVGKKNKKKKKNKSQQNASDLSKHFGSVTIDNSQNGTAHLDNLLQEEKGSGLKSLTSLLDKDDMFARRSPDIPVKKEEIKKEKKEPKDYFEPEKESSSEDEEFIMSRPSEDDIYGRNMWLINTIQQLCGTEENFSDFKSCSGSFRQGSLSANRYYEKCKILLGRKHFPMVFQELVDLLPDADKQEALIQIHNKSAPF